MMRRWLFTRETALLGVLVVMFTVFAVFVEGFFDWFNLFEQSRYWVVPGLIAVTMTFVIATGGIDLSVGSLVALCAVVLGLLYEDAGWPILAACAGALAVGALAGAFNGGISSCLGIPPLVVTLAAMVLFRGIAMVLARERAFSAFPTGFQWISQGDLFTIPAGAAGPIYFPAPLVPLIVTGVLGSALLRQSWVGRYTECIGENETAARFAAINTPRLKFGIYTASGAVCGLASLIYTAQYASAKADVAQGLELEVIACVVVGGTRISGGQASVVGSLLGLLIIGILRYGLIMAGMQYQHVTIFVGLLVIVTAVFNEWMAHQAQHRRGA